MNSSRSSFDVPVGDSDGQCNNNKMRKIPIKYFLNTFMPPFSMSEAEFLRKDVDSQLKTANCQLLTHNAWQNN